MRAIIKTTALKGRMKDGHFLEICDSSSKFYGGDQKWFRGSMDNYGICRSDFGSCGVIAAANVLAYMEKKGGENAGSIQKSDFLKLANDLYDRYLTPFDINKLGLIRLLKLKSRFSLGIWSISRFISGVLTFAADRGDKLSGVFISNNDLHMMFSFERACGFIREALKDDKPIVIFVTFNNSARQPGSTDRHYMVITQIDEEYLDSRLIGARVVVSSWGTEREIDFRSIWFDSPFNRAAVFLEGNPVTGSIGEIIRKKFGSCYLLAFKYGE